MADDFEEQMENPGRDLSSRVLLPNNISRKRLSNLFRPNVNGTYVMESYNGAPTHHHQVGKKPQDDANNNSLAENPVTRSGCLFSLPFAIRSRVLTQKGFTFSQIFMQRKNRNNHTFIKRAKIRCGPLEKPSVNGHERMKNDAYLHAY
ncbi:hypothetical protein DAPPUDRAFT_221366 [Daphnia pulex]|uniref:Uncharacterized protein n=1 Tax=Daphnia pulex TaxID=6669 RepID=E9FXU9_DAPPU|nr:hypothetical protein DAPPUDRAFT_221366 [Daphnia pulex]|eukprot:EFX88166.1 hypothetical protein DAPPUDRAFT_221366 [Daphnia pulex]